MGRQPKIISCMQPKPYTLNSHRGDNDDDPLQVISNGVRYGGHGVEGKEGTLVVKLEHEARKQDLKTCGFANVQVTKHEGAVRKGAGQE